MRNILAFVLLSLFFVSPATAYIPPAPSLIGDIAKKHGSGAYQIQLAVQILSENETASLKETWTVLDGDSMFMEATRDRVSFQFLYNDFKKYFRSNALKSLALENSFLEQYHHTRSGQSLAELFGRAGFVPMGLSMQLPKPKKVENIRYTRPPFVKLILNGATVAYRFQSKKGAEAIFDQETMDLLKLRLPSGEQLNCEEYQTFSHGLRFPKVRRLTWGNHTANIRLLSLDAVPTAQARKLLTTKKISNPIVFPTSHMGKIIAEFYARFR